MSAVQTSQEAHKRASGGSYRVIDELAAFKFVYGGFAIFGPRGQIVDRFRTRSAANHAAHLLNHGVAEVQPHAVVGCRVMPI